MRPGGGEKNSPPLPHPPWQIPLRSLRKILAIYPNECRSRSNAKLNAPSNASIALFSEDLAAKYLILLVGPGGLRKLRLFKTLSCPTLQRRSIESQGLFSGLSHRLRIHPHPSFRNQVGVSPLAARATILCRSSIPQLAHGPASREAVGALEKLAVASTARLVEINPDRTESRFGSAGRSNFPERTTGRRASAKEVLEQAIHFPAKSVGRLPCLR
jgi:hypothetical protein